MTEQDVFNMAREVCGKWPSLMSNPNLQAFAKLVAAKEREACALVCEKYAEVLDPLRPEGMAADYFQGGVKSAARRSAAAIRARGEA